MARKVLPTTATTKTQISTATPEWDALTNLGQQAGKVAAVGADIYKQAQAVKDQNDVNERSLLIEDEWNQFNADFKDNVNEDVVLGAIDEAAARQASLIDQDDTLSDRAKDSLLNSIAVNQTAARNTAMNNRAAANTKAAVGSFTRILDRAVDNRADIGRVESIINDNIAAGVITPEAGANLLSDTADAIKVGKVEDIINVVGQDNIEGRTKLDNLAGKVVESDFTTVQKNQLLDKIRISKSKLFSQESEYIISLKPKLNNGSLTQDDVDGISDPELKAKWQAELDIMNDNAGIAEQTAIAKAEGEDVKVSDDVYIAGLKTKLDAQTLTMTEVNQIQDPVKRAEWKSKHDIMRREKVVTAEEAIAANAVTAGKARAAESELLLTKGEKKKYVRYDSIGTNEIKTYEMTPAEHHQKLKLAIHKFNASMGVPDMAQPDKVYSGGNARKYLMMEIAAVANKDLREELEDWFLQTLQGQTNKSLFDVDEQAVARPQAFIKGSVYPKEVRPAIQKYEEQVANLITDPSGFGGDLGEADLELITAFNNGIDFLNRSFHEDKKVFRENYDTIINGALSEIKFVSSKKKAARAFETPSEAPQRSAEEQAAINWLNENPDHPQAESVRRKLGL